MFLLWLPVRPWLYLGHSFRFGIYSFRFSPLILGLVFCSSSWQRSVQLLPCGGYCMHMLPTGDAQLLFVWEGGTAVWWGFRASCNFGRNVSRSVRIWTVWFCTVAWRMLCITTFIVIVVDHFLLGGVPWKRRKAATGGYFNSFGGLFPSQIELRSPGRGPPRTGSLLCVGSTSRSRGCCYSRFGSMCCFP